ncbi:MAG: hypothetical protein KAI47_06520, partial [Deltaproteobacteria bacterium]|nr:hypothetical protein [Deltaproteobacteria bacterium]
MFHPRLAATVGLCALLLVPQSVRAQDAGPKRAQTQPDAGAGPKSRDAAAHPRPAKQPAPKPPASQRATTPTSTPTSVELSARDSLARRLADLKRQKRALSALPATTFAPGATSFPNVFSGCNLATDEGARACRSQLELRAKSLNARIEILRTRYKTLEPLLSRPIRVAERYRRRQRRGRPP